MQTSVSHGAEDNQGTSSRTSGRGEGKGKGKGGERPKKRIRVIHSKPGQSYRRVREKTERTGPCTVHPHCQSLSLAEFSWAVWLSLLHCNRTISITSSRLMEQGNPRRRHHRKLPLPLLTKDKMPNVERLLVYILIWAIHVARTRR